MLYNYITNYIDNTHYYLFFIIDINIILFYKIL